MGQKVNPTGFRVGKFKNWKSRWCVEDSSFKDLLFEDLKIRDSLKEKVKLAGVESIEIERLSKNMVVILTVSRPGVVIGRGGTGIEDIKKEILRVITEVRGSVPRDFKIDIKVNEVKNSEISAPLVAQRIAFELQRRIPHRRVVTKAIERVMQSGALGIKVVLSGRLGGAEISRTEKFHKGSVPTQTLRENIDYAEIPALLKRGYVGIKVYIHKKEED